MNLKKEIFWHIIIKNKTYFCHYIDKNQPHKNSDLPKILLHAPKNILHAHAEALQ